MLPSLITVTFLATLATIQPCYGAWVQQALPTTKFVYGVFRHGPRSPLTLPYLTFENTAAHDEQYKPVLAGGLTYFGMKRMYKAGKWMWERYQLLLSAGYKEEEVWISARGASRAVMTALCMMAGMFVPSQVIFHDLKWQPIPIWGIYEDKSYMFHDFEFKKYDVCPKYKLLALRLEDGLLKKEVVGKPLYKALQRYTGERDIKNILSAFRIYDHLNCEINNGMILPSWATEKITLGKPIYPDALMEDLDAWKVSPDIEQLMQLHIGPMFRNINEQFSKKALHINDGIKFNLHVTEDTTLYGIFRTLGINYLDLYEPGNGILLELHNDSGLLVVRFYHYNAKTEEVLEIPATNCEEVPCTLATFQKKFPGITLEQWNELCKID